MEIPGHERIKQDLLKRYNTWENEKASDSVKRLINAKLKKWNEEI